MESDYVDQDYEEYVDGEAKIDYESIDDEVKSWDNMG